MSTTSRSKTASSPRCLARLVVAPMLCAAAVAAPAPALAQTITDSDATGDMVRYVDGGQWRPAPDRTRNDVSSTTLTHSATRIRIRVRYVDLRRTTYHALLVWMATDEGARRQVSLEAEPDRPAGRVTMVNRNGRKVRCSIHHVIDYAAETATIGFSRRCVGNPQWVRFSVGVMSADDQLYLDDALRDRPLDDSDRGYARSPRVYREANS